MAQLHLVKEAIPPLKLSFGIARGVFRLLGQLEILELIHGSVNLHNTLITSNENGKLQFMLKNFEYSTALRNEKGREEG